MVSPQGRLSRQNFSFFLLMYSLLLFCGFHVYTENHFESLTHIFLWDDSYNNCSKQK